MALAGGLTGKVIALLSAGVSPAFVTFLLLKVSGVPLSEKKYDKRYGDREDYKKWKRETPMFIPKL
jgi:steroid 5-alpha reductase family enzyme